MKALPLPNSLVTLIEPRRSSASLWLRWSPESGPVGTARRGEWREGLEQLFLVRQLDANPGIDHPELDWAVIRRRTADLEPYDSRSR
jgi:hypothetical protein